jgi:arylsulfatase A
MDRREFCKLTAAGGITLALPRWLTGLVSADDAAAGKPNIICILSDNLGLGDVSCYGADHYKTPNIDAMAKGGIRFERCFATPLCGPSRCELLTGQYPFRTGLWDNHSHKRIRPGKEVMIPTVMRQAGYVTALSGKWGQMPLGPRQWGFDEHLTFGGNGKYWADQGGYTLNGQSKELGPEEYLPDVMHKFVVDFITRHRDKPFFVYYPMSHIHKPMLRTPDSKPGEELTAANIAYMDKLVGQLVAEVDRLKLREKTLIVFMGDNGAWYTRNRHCTINGKPLSGVMGSLYEGGSHVPMVANWPGTVPAGKALRDLVDFSDFLPTFAELGSAKLPPGRTIDGRSFAAQLRGGPGKPREWIYVELSGKRYVRDDRWKFTGAGELFDMKEAPFKDIPVAADTTDPGAVAAKKHLREVLVGLVGAERMGGPGGLDNPSKKRGAGGEQVPAETEEETP